MDDSTSSATGGAASSVVVGAMGGGGGGSGGVVPASVKHFFVYCTRFGHKETTVRSLPRSIDPPL